jgi:hypothetical protein
VDFLQISNKFNETLSSILFTYYNHLKKQMDILLAECTTQLKKADVKKALEKKQTIDAVIQTITLHLKLISALAIETKTSYVQKSLKSKK